MKKLVISGSAKFEKEIKKILENDLYVIISNTL